MYYLPLLLALGLLVALHELGHLVAARLLGVRVTRYTLGFGPAVFTWRLGGTDYVLGAVPLGGSARIHGMNPHEPGLDPADPTSFSAQRPWKRMLVLMAGPLANGLFALGILVALYTSGTHVVVPLTVGTITPGSEAARAQLLPGDRIVSVDGTPLASWAEFVELVAQRPGRELKLGVEREGEPREVTVRPRPDERGAGRIGVSQQYVYRTHGPGQALLQALAHSGNLVIEGTKMLGRMLQGKQGVVLNNPVGVVKQSSGAAGSGLGAFLRVLVSLSVALAFFHLLPLPSLDGGRMLFVLFESVSGRKVPTRVETLVHAVGFLALLAVVLTVALADLRQHLGRADTSAQDSREPGDNPLSLWERGGMGASPSPALPDGGLPDGGPLVTPVAATPDAGITKHPAASTEATSPPDGGQLLTTDRPGE
ncbi:RIP metalloprotease [Vitiosangium sp. GDMCC 1.1324]|uniref:M50 family metallopeptidase n=1 Tax=Vitiosangium sp. (strain GDMCC 1.1324) TaxID=2138576 RepID=UPI000D3BA86B|nr:M50 family metallopeptidase [Vitiosangium sp. GDMCC 1.1324]PTL77518.1 peptidase M50 [Vitiosangium sp. GDMCC 1.1324]